MTLKQLRESARALLNEFDAADGLASYYALYHDPKRTMLSVYHGPGGQPEGFLVNCQTGFDLFRPLVTLRVRGVDAIPYLIQDGLTAGRPYLLVVPEHLVERLENYAILSEPIRNMILRLEPGQFKPKMNVLVTYHTAPDGSPRTEIRVGEKIGAMAGVNWRSPIFAEIYVQVQPYHRGRGWGQAVVSGLIAELLKMGVTPLYHVDETNTSSRELANRLGFVDTGAREIVSQAVRADTT